MDGQYQSAFQPRLFITTTMPTLALLAVATAFVAPTTPMTRRSMTARTQSIVAISIPGFSGSDPKRKYGTDPRSWLSDVDWHPENERSTADNIGQVNELHGGVAHLQHVIENAGKRAVVIKFKRKSCPACNSTVERFAAAAERHAEHAQFYTVDFDDCRAFCKQCGIAVVPCAHVYSGNELVDTLPLGPSKWDAFAARLVEIIAANAACV